MRDDEMPHQATVDETQTREPIATGNQSIKTMSDAANDNANSTDHTKPNPQSTNINVNVNDHVDVDVVVDGDGDGDGDGFSYDPCISSRSPAATVAPARTRKTPPHCSTIRPRSPGAS